MCGRNRLTAFQTHADVTIMRVDGVADVHRLRGTEEAQAHDDLATTTVFVCVVGQSEHASAGG